MFVIVPIRLMATLTLDLWVSETSMLFSERASRSTACSLSNMHLFRWGRKRDGSTEFASLLRDVTPSVAKLPWRIWVQVALLTLWRVQKRDLMFIQSCSLVTIQIFRMRSASPVAWAEQVVSRTTSHPGRRAGVGQFSRNGVVVGNVAAKMEKEELVNSFLCFGFLLGILRQS
jgi:hypothetical protein